VTDKNTGRTYFYCKPTKKTSWKKPACMEDVRNPLLAPRSVHSHLG
jgi:hypothetical protein